MRVLWIAVLILIVDQFTKVLIIQNMYVGQSIPIFGDWFKFSFTENPGMAFGITFGPKGFIPFLSITATSLILLYLYRVRESYYWYRFSIGCILGGALGNIIDRVFYGMIFYDNKLFTGHVVDFMHLNIWAGTFPESWPFIGGKYSVLFPIWNFADMAIVVGVLGILFFQKKFQDSIYQLESEQANSEAGNGAEENGSESAVSSGISDEAGVKVPAMGGENGLNEEKAPSSNSDQEPSVGQ